jgi:4-hydroxybenzoate polyprenyltransferase
VTDPNKALDSLLTTTVRGFPLAVVLAVAVLAAWTRPGRWILTGTARAAAGTVRFLAGRGWRGLPLAAVLAAVAWLAWPVAGHVASGGSLAPVLTVFLLVAGVAVGVVTRVYDRRDRFPDRDRDVSRETGPASGRTAYAPPPRGSATGTDDAPRTRVAPGTGWWEDGK